MRHFLLVALFATVFVSCDTEDTAFRTTPKSNSNLGVNIIHPILLEGPNYLVKVYYIEESGNPNLDVPNQEAITDTSGNVFFENVATGAVRFSCEAPGDPGFYAEKTINVGIDTTVFDTLRLQ